MLFASDVIKKPKKINDNDTALLTTQRSIHLNENKPRQALIMLEALNKKEEVD